MSEFQSVDLTAEGVRVNGTLLDALTVGGLTELLGEPRVVRPADPTRSTAVIWDDAGVRGYTKDDENVGELSVQLTGDPAWAENIEDEARQFFPTSSFPGTVTIDGRPPLEAIAEKDLRKARAFLETSLGDWEAELSLSQTECGELRSMAAAERLAKSKTGELANIVRNAAHPFRELTITAPKTKPAPKPSGKWQHKAATEPVMELASFPFRVAIIQELMYEQDLLSPRFDVHDFAQDPNGFGDKMIPAVQTWFEELPIPVRLADHVETLVLDGGNDIYLQLIPQWDGEDDTFVIKTLSADDLAPFTRLRTVDDIGGFLGPDARAALADRGITVE